MNPRHGDFQPITWPLTWYNAVRFRLASVRFRWVSLYLVWHRWQWFGSGLPGLLHNLWKDREMTGYTNTIEIMDAADAIDTLNEIRRDLRGLAALLLNMNESPSAPDPAALDLAHDVALAIGDAAEAAFPIAEAALMADHKEA